MGDRVVGHQAVFDAVIGGLRKLAEQFGVTLDLPGKAGLEAETEFLEYEPEKRLSARIRVPEKWANPLGFLQGGYLTAMVDNLFGGLSLLAAGAPATSISLVTHFMRHAIAGEWLTITTVVRRRGRNVMFLEADVVNAEGKLVAVVSSPVQILPLGPAANG